MFFITRLRNLYGYLDKKNWHYVFQFSVTLIGVAVIIAVSEFNVLARVVALLFFAFPVWGPILVVVLWWTSWKRYIRSLWLFKQESVLLEIRIPKDLHKTPKAMEVVFNGFNVRSGMTTFVTRNWYGGVGFEWSFEMYSYEGTIRFYARVPVPMKEYAETQIYSQYPEVEIHEVPDYTSGLYFVPDKMKVYAVEHLLTRGDAWPIRTYVDFELEDLDIEKHEEKISDPLGSVFERLSDLQKGEQVMLQILFRQTRKNELMFPWLGFRSGKKTWKEQLRRTVKEIYKGAKLEFENVVTGDIELGFAQLKPGEMVQVKALERGIDKLGFDVGVRLVHFGTNEGYQPQINSPYFSQIWRQVSSDKFNNLMGGSRYWQQSMDYFWQDPFGIRLPRMNRQVFDAYKRRRIFDPPYDHYHNIMSSEELASIFHFPGIDCEAPGIARITSRKMDAPSNLPT